MYLEEQIESKFTDQFCHNTPEFTWVRGADFKFKHTTTTAAKMSGFNSFDQLIGLTAYDLKSPVVQSAPEFDRQVTKVIHSGQPLEMLDIHTFDNQHLQIYLTTLSPIYNTTDEVKSVHGKCTDLNKQYDHLLSTHLLPNLSQLINLNRSISLSLEIIDRYDCLNLTLRESECFYFATRGHSNQFISELLCISPRTVDDHINAIKFKIGHKKRGAIIDYAVALDLIRYIPRSLLTNLTMPRPRRSTFAPVSPCPTT